MCFSSLQDITNKTLYIRGNGLGLHWDKGIALRKIMKDTWQTVITYKWSLHGFECQSCNQQGAVYLADNKLQFRIMINDKIDMRGPNYAVLFPLSQTSSYFDTHPEFVVYPWFYTDAGTLGTFHVDSSILGQTKELVLYTPPSFSENQFKTYPTVLVFDLNEDFAKFFKKNFENPILRAISEEFVLVGYGDFNFLDGEREHVLTPVPGPFIDCANGSYNCDGCIPDGVNATEFERYLSEKCGKQITFRGDGEKTIDFFTKEAVKESQKITDFRIDEAKLGVMGYSLGGLLSCHAAWTRPHVFSFAACQSPSLWYPLKNDSLSEPQFHFINHTLKDPVFSVNRKEQKYYIDCGGAEIDAPYNMAQAAVEVGQIISSFNLFKLDQNVWVDIDPGKYHGYTEWGKRIGLALATLLRAPGEPGMPDLVTNQASKPNSLPTLHIFVYISMLKGVLIH